MIIIGYQGIGKSTLASKTDKIIDLESSSFWKYDKDGNAVSRDEDWYIYYCQVANHLSAQGYTVFVSCHPEVRDYLIRRRTEKLCIIFPALGIKNEWINKLGIRYASTKSQKDLKALERAKTMYITDIDKLYYESGMGYYDDAIVLNDINYNLQEAVCKLSKDKEKGVDNEK